MKIIATTLTGLESVLAQEIRELGGIDVVELKRAVSYTGSKSLLYRSNLMLRTALKVLVPMFSFKAKNDQELYDHIYEYNWTEHIPLDKTISINAVTNSTLFTHSQYAALKTKDAIVDRIRADKNARPSVDVKNPDFKFNIHIQEDHVDVSLDSSGDSLHRRGYRKKAVEAPLNEVLAAGMVLLSGWDRRRPLLDPMCGSGTILIEAQRMAKNIPPQSIDRNFTFKKWTDFDAQLWDRVVAQSLDEQRSRSALVMGGDRSKHNLRVAEVNIRNANLSKLIKVKESDFFQSGSDRDDLVIITNPPYDIRLQTFDINHFYRRLGDTLKHYYNNSETWIICGNKEAIKNIGLKPNKNYQLMNGAVRSTFSQYVIYNSSKEE